MKKLKHTPGPWKAHYNVPTAVIPGHLIKADNETQTPIASLWVGGGTKGKPRQLANARLIAESSEMLKTMINSFKMLFKLWDTEEWDYDEVKNQINCMQDNIEKATGLKISDII